MATRNYTVKTRNFHCRKWVKSLLDLSHRYGVQRGDSYTDGDGKYILETSSAVKAWSIWAYFILLRRFSGGWTYIVCPGAELSGYGSIHKGGEA